MKKQIIEIPLTHIKPDVNQPRKLFTPERLEQLRASITEYGIMNPLLLEKTNSGYIIIDGERRFRVATILKMRTVPATIIEAQTDIARLMKQFHIQEQHENWTASEKAKAVSRLSKITGKGVKEISEILALPKRTIEEYISYGRLVIQNEFTESKLALPWARGIVATSNTVEKVMTLTNKEFPKEKRIKFELALLRHIKDNNINSTRELVQLKDALVSNPALISTIISAKEISPQQLYVKSNAKTERIHRMCRWQFGYVSKLIKECLETDAYKLFTKDDTSKVVLLINYAKKLQSELEE